MNSIVTYRPVRISCVLLALKVIGRSQQRRSHEIVCSRFRYAGVQEIARKFLRRRSGSPEPRRSSTVKWVLAHTGKARASNFLPRGVSTSRRARWSRWSGVILIRRRRCSGFRAAVKVVRSIASSDATAPIVGASGRFKDIIRENCPFVIPSGRNALSKRRARARAARCTWRQRQESRTRIVVSYDVVRTFVIGVYYIFILRLIST